MEELLPESVVAVESHGDDPAGDASLYPEELALLTRAVGKRRREFATVRVCARRAMEKLGVAPGPVLPGERGAPRWPHGRHRQHDPLRGLRRGRARPHAAISSLSASTPNPIWHSPRTSWTPSPSPVSPTV